jgi:hypothetical protein
MKFETTINVEMLVEVDTDFAEGGIRLIIRDIDENVKATVDLKNDENLTDNIYHELLYAVGRCTPESLDNLVRQIKIRVGETLPEDTVESLIS